MLLHSQQIMIIFWIQVALCLNMEMNDHYISYIMFNKWAIHEWMIFLSIELQQLMVSL
jgi:hypothetical protein